MLPASASESRPGNRCLQPFGEKSCGSGLRVTPGGVFQTVTSFPAGLLHGVSAVYLVSWPLGDPLTFFREPFPMEGPKSLDKVECWAKNKGKVFSSGSFYFSCTFNCKPPHGGQS